MRLSRRELLIALAASSVSGATAFAIGATTSDTPSPNTAASPSTEANTNHVNLLAAAETEGMAVATDSQYAGGADPTWSRDSTEAFRAAAATNKPVYVPPGAYRFAGPGIDVAAPTFIGAGQGATTISIRANTWFIDSNRRWDRLTLSGIRFDGGGGHVRNQYTGGNVADQFIVGDCAFINYTGTSIGNRSSDHPYWKIERNIFRSGNYTSSTGISLTGLTDGTSIRDNAFHANRVHIALAEGGNNTYIENNDFLRFGASQGPPRVDVWFKPAAIEQNSGQGMRITSCKFGNENLAPTDFRIVYAAATADGFPDLITKSSGFIGGHIVDSIFVNGIGNQSLIPVIRSTTPNVVGGKYGPITIAGSTGAPILSSTTPLKAQSTNSFGPLLRANSSTAPLPQLVVSDGA